MNAICRGTRRPTLKTLERRVSPPWLEVDLHLDIKIRSKSWFGFRTRFWIESTTLGRLRMKQNLARIPRQNLKRIGLDVDRSWDGFRIRFSDEAITLECRPWEILDGSVPESRTDSVPESGTDSVSDFPTGSLRYVGKQ